MCRSSHVLDGVQIPNGKRPFCGLSCPLKIKGNRCLSHPDRIRGRIVLQIYTSCGVFPRKECLVQLALILLPVLG